MLVERMEVIEHHFDSIHRGWTRRESTISSDLPPREDPRHVNFVTVQQYGLNDRLTVPNRRESIY